VVQGVVLATALIFVLLSLVADLLYMAINPRLRQA
jgi:peptide/nickel transport system permease protein